MKLLVLYSVKTANHLIQSSLYKKEGKTNTSN